MFFYGIFILILSSGSHFVYKRGTICIILVEGLVRNFVRNYLDMDQNFFIEQMSFRTVFFSSKVSFGGQFVNVSGTICAFLTKRHHGEQMCGNILNIGRWYRRR